jgi:hypothetical protein
MRVTNAEVNAREHDAYLAVISSHAGPVGEMMLSMGMAAGRAARSQTPSAFTVAVFGMQRVGEEAAAFLDALAATQCPAYLRGADNQVQDALKLLVDGGRRGVEAAQAGHAERLNAAAAEMEGATQDIVAAAYLIGAWRSGAARP